MRHVLSPVKNDILIKPLLHEGHNNRLNDEHRSDTSCGYIWFPEVSGSIRWVFGRPADGLVQSLHVPLLGLNRLLPQENDSHSDWMEEDPGQVRTNRVEEAFIQ